MKAKFVFEKFLEDSDPISDMDIGMMPQIKKFIREETNYKDVESDYLWICARYGKLEFVKYLLEDDIDIHHWDDAALRFASERGHAEVVKVLLDAGADVHARDDEALRWASANGPAEVVKILLDAGADVHADNDWALRRASVCGHAEVVKILLDAGADTHIWDYAALRWASENGHAEVVKILKDHIAKEKKKAVRESLLEKFTEDSDPISDMGIGLMSQIKKFVKEGKHTSYFDEEKDYLWICAKYGKLEFVKYLIEKGADVFYERSFALRIAANHGYLDIVKAFLDSRLYDDGLHDNDLKEAFLLAETRDNHDICNLLKTKIKDNYLYL